MLDGGVGRRYARALFESYPLSEVEGVLESLKVFLSVWEGSKVFREAMLNPLYSIDERKGVLFQVAERIRCGDSKFSSFFCILLEGGRIRWIKDIYVKFVELVDEARRVLSLEVTSAYELSEVEKGEILERFSRRFGGLVSVLWRVDEGLIGGFVVRCGDKVIDGSIVGGLRRAERVLGL